MRRTRCCLPGLKLKAAPCLSEHRLAHPSLPSQNLPYRVTARAEHEVPLLSFRHINLCSAAPVLTINGLSVCHAFCPNLDKCYLLYREARHKTTYSAQPTHTKWSDVVAASYYSVQSCVVCDKKGFGRVRYDERHMLMSHVCTLHTRAKPFYRDQISPNGNRPEIQPGNTYTANHSKSGSSRPPDGSFMRCGLVGC